MTDRSVVHGSFTVERSYPTTPHRVFTAWASQPEKNRWFGEGDDFLASTSEYTLDFRVGGHERHEGMQTAPGYTPPTWPDPTSSMQMHLDFLVDDLEATEARVLAAGATKYDCQPNADHCRVFADPAGHPFCLTTWDDMQS